MVAGSRSKAFDRVVALAVALLVAGALAAPIAALEPPRVRVALAQTPRLARAADVLGALGWIEVVAAGEPAALSVTETDDPAGALVLRDADGAVLDRLAGADGEATERELVGWAQRLLVATLENPTPPFDLEFRVEREGASSETGPVRVVAPGTEIRWEARNRSPHPLWLTVFAISPEQGVSLVYPFRARPKPLAPGQAVSQSGEVSLPEGLRTSTDRLTLVATRAPLDARVFLEPPRLAEGLAALARTEWRTARHELVVRRELAEIVEPGRPDEPIVAPEDRRPASNDSVAASNDSAVASMPLSASKRSPRITRFGVHFAVPPELGAVQSRLGKLPSLCGRSGAACKVRRMFSDGGIFELERTGRRLGEGATQTVAAAFEQAYEIRDGLGALRVEPFLELEMSTPHEQGAIGAGDPPPDPTAGDDWHLTHLRASEAWAALRLRLGRSAGREGEGILVGQLDTGYRPHPELFDGAGAARPVRVAAGWDYVDADADAIDPLRHGGPLEASAHGTGSGSVLVSPSGCQLSGQPGCVHGVARGAELAPVRVHRAVSHFHSGRLARALHDAATGALPERVDLASVAMAGPPGWALWWSVREAAQRGLPVVAAAGDGVGPVLWPARFPGTLAATATRSDCQRSRTASRGSAVDVAAPGAALWRAGVDARGVEVNRPGSGTPLAASATSGAVALWLARWSGDARLEELRRKGQLTRALREALRVSAWKPGRGAPAGTRCAPSAWDPASGPGILDLAALLDREPALPGDAAFHELSDLRQLPLFASLYATGAPPARPLADYRGLFALADSAPLERVAFFEAEVLHHYVLGSEVTGALDAITASSGSPSAGAFATARRALLRRGLSQDLRAALRAAEDGSG